MRQVSVLALIGLLAGSALNVSSAQSPSATQGYFRSPSLSGDTVVFVAEGDLWRARVDASTLVTAQRLTTHLAAESHPSISPDGKRIAFTARYEGPAEVYVMPIEGGLPTRLTFDGDFARVQGWASNDEVIYATTRYAGMPTQRLIRVNAATKQQTLVPLAEAAEACVSGSALVFARAPLNSDNVKNYQGGSVQRLWRFDGNGEAKLISGAHRGTARQPMCAGDRVYFLSDRGGGMNIWSMRSDGSDGDRWQQHTRYDGKRDFDIRGASLSAAPQGQGLRIVFQHGADLKLHDVSTGDTRTLSIRLASDFEHTRTRWVRQPWDFVTAVSPSPTGDRVALTTRGQIVVAPVGNGRRVTLTRSNSERARNGTFSSDGKSVYAFDDRSGEFEIARFAANGVGDSKAISKGAKTLRTRLWPSPDGKWIAHTDLTRQLYLLNLGSGEERVLDRSAYGAHEAVVWSPDNRWLAIVKQARNDFLVLSVVEIATGKMTSLTSDRYHASSPVFTPDGKWLYFIGDRHLQSVVTNPWGQRNPEPYFDRQGKLYALALDPKARWPFLAKDELQSADKPVDDKAAEKATERGTLTAPRTAAPSTPAGKVQQRSDEKPSETADKSKAPEAKANPFVLDGIRERLFEVPIPPNNYTNLSTDGKRLFFIVNEPGAEPKQHLRSVAIEAPNPAAPTVDSFLDDIRSAQMTLDRKKIMVRKANDLYVFDAGKSAPPPSDFAKFQVNLRDWMMAIDPREEWQQMFVDAWRMHRDYFYDPNMHGADWVAARAKYAPLVARVTDRAELSDVLAQLVSEVSALHSQVGGEDLRRGSESVDIGFFAADFARAENGLRVTKLYGGDPELLEERSPFARAEVGIKVGDVITAINGRSTKEVASVGELTRESVGKQVLISLAAAGENKARDVIVTPISAARDKALRYLDWERSRMAAVESASDARIGYVHLQAMGPADIARWAREFYPVYQREGLIIDLRQNNGGSIDSWIIEKLQRRAWHFWQSRRDDDGFRNQQLAFRGHVVALIDGGTYSDGETMAQGLRRLGIAPLIGTTTAGAGIWLSDQNRLVDNGIARAAEFGSYVDTPKERAWITEFVGVAPDVEVDNLPHETFKGRDAQLEAAIAYLKDKMAKEPLRAPVVPPFPLIGK